MYRLSGYDASLLYMETRKVPMTGYGLWDLDVSTMPGGYSFDRFRAKLSERIPALPEFRMKLVDSAFNLDTPVWVDDPDFDIDNHLHRIELLPPAGPRQLSKLIERLMTERLDRSLPLWDMWVIEGLSGADPQSSGRVAVLHRMHHVVADATTYLELLSRLCSTEADAPPPPARAGPGTVGKWQIVLDGLVRFARRPWFLVTTVVPEVVLAIIKTVLRAVRGQAMSGMLSTPRTPFNGNVTERRSVAYVQLDLDDVETVKDRFGVTVNEVMMALVSGALRHFLLDRAALPRAALVAAMPISVYQPSRASRNQVSFMVSKLYTDIADPAERLKAIAKSSSIGKAHSSAMGPTLLQDVLQFDPGLMARGMRLYRWTGLSGRLPVYNLTLSNVHVPQAQCYLMGAAVRARYAFGPVFHGGGLNITVMSLNGNLDVGLVSCADLLPDLWDLADDIPIALKELLAAAERAEFKEAAPSPRAYGVR
jgi:diacylglycerol O-acyltransferase / wax synthase